MILDASAVIALLRNEAGARAVTEAHENAWICAVNVTEVVSKLIDNGGRPDTALRTVANLGYKVVDFSVDLALRAGVLRTSTRAHGLSLGDRACLALAERERLPVLTTDRAWASLDLGIEVVLIR